jgi:hypothetical protein
MCDIFITLTLCNYYVFLPFVNIDYYSVNGSLEINNQGELKDIRCKIRFLIIIIIINNNCLIKSVVYIAEVRDDTGLIRNYIAMTSNTFRKRYYTTTYKTSFQDTSYVKSTELSKYIWNLKNKNHNFKIKWSIPKQAPLQPMSPRETGYFER